MSDGKYGQRPLKVQEIDGDPKAIRVDTIKITNDKLIKVDERTVEISIPKTCEEIETQHLSGATVINQCDWNDSFGSSGQRSGGIITDAGSGTINVSAGTGFIKATDDDTATLFACNWDAVSGLEIPLNSTRYVGVHYSEGSALVCLHTTQDWDLDTNFPLGSVINMNGTLYILNNPWWVTDGITNLIEKSVGVAGYLARDKYVGGLILGVTATRYPTMTAGTIWGRTNEFEMSAIDLSVSTVTSHSAIIDVDNGDSHGTITASSGTPYSLLHDGQWLIISGTSDNDGTYRVLSVVGDNVITFETVLSGTDGTEATTDIHETFATYWFESDGTVHETTGLTQYPVTQWNDIDNDTLTNLLPNKYANWWVIINVTSDELAFIYPSAYYSSSAGAEAEEVPSTIPADWWLEGVLIGRILIKTSTDTPIEVQSAFTQQFTPAQASDHGNLSGLEDESDHPSYLTLDGARAMTGALTTSHGTIQADATASGIITLASTGGVNNGTCTFDLETTAGATIIGGGAWFFNASFALNDRISIYHGTGLDARTRWETTNNDSLQLGLRCNSVNYTGYYSIMEYADMGNANRSPLAPTAHPTLRIYGNDVNEALDYGEFFYNGGFNIQTGQGSLKLQPNAVGDVTIAEDTDVADDADSKKLILHRKTSASDTNISIGINADESCSVVLNEITNYSGRIELADTATFALPTGKAGFLKVFIGDMQEHGYFEVTSAGVVHLSTSSDNVSITSGTDESLNVYDGGTGAVIENQLGETLTATYIFEYI